MQKKGLKVGSVTLAIKGRELLQRNGYKAYLARNPYPVKGEGCGYLIYTEGNTERAIEILRNNGIRVTGTADGSEFL